MCGYSETCKARELVERASERGGEADGCGVALTWPSVRLHVRSPCIMAQVLPTAASAVNPQSLSHALFAWVMMKGGVAVVKTWGTSASGAIKRAYRLSVAPSRVPSICPVIEACGEVAICWRLSQDENTIWPFS